jgi:hypothetical protein
MSDSQNQLPSKFLLEPNVTMSECEWRGKFTLNGGVVTDQILGHCSVLNQCWGYIDAKRIRMDAFGSYRNTHVLIASAVVYLPDLWDVSLCYAIYRHIALDVTSQDVVHI